MKLWQKNLILIALGVLLAAFPLFYAKDAEFAGADGLADVAISEINPVSEPWFPPIFEPKSGEIESLLFALQAAIGAGIIGFITGRMTKKAQ